MALSCPSSNENKQMGGKHMKGFLASLVIWETQIKSTVNSFTPGSTVIPRGTIKETRSLSPQSVVAKQRVGLRQDWEWTLSLKGVLSNMPSKQKRGQKECKLCEILPSGWDGAIPITDPQQLQIPAKNGPSTQVSHGWRRDSEDPFPPHWGVCY